MLFRSAVVVAGTSEVLVGAAVVVAGTSEVLVGAAVVVAGTSEVLMATDFAGTEVALFGSWLLHAITKVSVTANRPTIFGRDRQGQSGSAGSTHKTPCSMSNMCLTRYPVLLQPTSCSTGFIKGYR